MKIKTKNKLIRGVFFVEVEPRINQLLTVKDIEDQFAEMYNWCVKNFGPAGDMSKIPHLYWYTLGKHFYFSEPKDATAFALRFA